MTYPVIVILEVLTVPDYDISEPPISFYRELKLPFAPTVGISLHQEGWFCGPLAQVEWHETLEGFICRVAPDDILVRENISERDRPSQEELIDFLIDDGWQRLGKGHSYPVLLGGPDVRV